MHADAPAKTIESTYGPAFREIRKRSEATREAQEIGRDTVRHFPATSTTLPFRLPEQEYALVTMGTAVLAPCPVDASRPSLRVYGMFGSREECVEHADVVRGLDPTCSLVVCRRDAWTLMPNREDTRDDADASAARVEAKLRAHRARVMASDRAFEAAVKEGVPRADLPVRPDTTEDDVETREAEALVYKPPRRLRTGAEVRGQAAVALCIVPDEFGECLVKFLGCFESASVAQEWVEGVASRHIVEEDIVVADTCEWFYPNAERQRTQTHYRVPELQRIMDAAERNPETVRNYKAWKAEQDASESQLLQQKTDGKDDDDDE